MRDSEREKHCGSWREHQYVRMVDQSFAANFHACPYASYSMLTVPSFKLFVLAFFITFMKD